MSMSQQGMDQGDYGHGQGHGQQGGGRGGFDDSAQPYPAGDASGYHAALEAHEGQQQYDEAYVRPTLLPPEAHERTRRADQPPLFSRPPQPASASASASASAYAHPAYGQQPSHPLYSRRPSTVAANNPYAHPAYGSPSHPHHHQQYHERPASSAGSRPSSSYGASSASQGGYDGAIPSPMQHPAYASRSSSFSQPLPPMSLVPDDPPSSTFRFSPQAGPLPSISQAQSIYQLPQQQQSQRGDYQQAGDAYSAGGDQSFGFAPPPANDHDSVAHGSYADSSYAHDATFSHPAYARASTATQRAPPSLSINTSFARPSTSHAAPVSAATPASAHGSQTSPWAGPPPPASLSLGGLAQRRRSATDAVQHHHQGDGAGGGRRVSHEEEERRRASLAGPVLHRSVGPASAGPVAGRRSVDFGAAAGGLVGPASANQSPEVHSERPLGPAPIGGPGPIPLAPPREREREYAAARSPQFRFAPPALGTANGPTPLLSSAPLSVSARERRASGDRERGAVARVDEEYEGEGDELDELREGEDEGDRGENDDEGTATQGASERTSRAASAGSRAGTPLGARRASAASSAGGGKRRRRSTAGDEMDEDEDFEEDAPPAGGRTRKEPTSKKFVSRRYFLSLCSAWNAR